MFKTVIIKEFELKSDARKYESKLFKHLRVSKNSLYINYGNSTRNKSHTPRVSLKEKERIFHEQLKNFMGDLYHTILK